MKAFLHEILSCIPECSVLLFLIFVSILINHSHDSSLFFTSYVCCQTHNKRYLLQSPPFSKTNLCLQNQIKLDQRTLRTSTALIFSYPFIFDRFIMPFLDEVFDKATAEGCMTDGSSMLSHFALADVYEEFSGIQPTSSAVFTRRGISCYY